MLAIVRQIPIFSRLPITLHAPLCRGVYSVLGSPEEALMEREYSKARRLCHHIRRVVRITESV